MITVITNLSVCSEPPSNRDTYVEDKMYATPKSIKEQKEKPQNVDVNENCKVAKFDPIV